LREVGKLGKYNEFSKKFEKKIRKKNKKNINKKKKKKILNLEAEMFKKSGLLEKYITKILFR